MYRFLVDETNNVADPDKFFIVGGLMFDDDQVRAVHDGIERIRDRHGYRNGDKLKFQISSRPPDVSQEAATSAKREVISLLVDHDVPMVTYLGLNAIVNSGGPQQRMSQALNTVVGAYRKFLVGRSGYGEMIIDRDDLQISHLREVFQHGIMSRSIGVRDRIVLFGTTSDGLSHLSSAVDIALGGFRFCVNSEAATDDQRELAAAIFGPISKLLWYEVHGDRRQIGGYGYLMRPLAIRSTRYQERYRHLREKLASLSAADAEEEPDAAVPGAVDVANVV